MCVNCQLSTRMITALPPLHSLYLSQARTVDCYTNHKTASVGNFTHFRTFIFEFWIPISDCQHHTHVAFAWDPSATLAVFKGVRKAFGGALHRGRARDLARPNGKRSRSFFCSAIERAEIPALQRQEGRQDEEDFQISMQFMFG